METSPDSARRYMNIPQTAKLVGVAQQTLKRWRAAGDFISPAVYVGDSPGWDVAEVMEFIRAVRHGQPATLSVDSWIAAAVSAVQSQATPPERTTL